MNRILQILGLVAVAHSFADTTSLALVQVDAQRAAQNNERIRIDSKEWQGRATNLAELLSELSGVSTQKNGGWGSFQTISVQGMGGQRLQVLLDGFPLNSSSGHTFDLASIPLSQLSSIELIKNSSWENGSSSGGLLLLHSKYTKSLVAAAQIGSQGYVQANAGMSFGEQWIWNTKLDFARADNDFVYLDRQVAPYSPHLSYEHRMQNAQFMDYSGEVQARRKWATRSFSTQLRVENESQGLPGREGAWNPHASWQSTRVIGGMDYKGGNENFCESHGLRLSLRRDDLHWSAEDPAFSGNSTTGGDYTQRIYSAEERSMLSGSLGISKLSSSWLLLMEHLKPEPLARQGFPSIPATRKEIDFNQEINFPLPFGLEWQNLGQFKWWNDQAEQVVEVKDIRLDWNSGLQWQALKSTQVYVKYGSISRIPGLSERFGSGVGTLGNPNLSPEYGSALHSGVNFQGKTLSASLGFFQRELDSAISPVYSTGMVKYVNLGGIRNFGFEPSLKWNAPWLRVNWNATLQEPRVQSARKSEQGNLAPGESKISTNLSLSTPIGPVELGSRVKFWSEIFRDMTNFQRVPPGQNLDLWIKSNWKNWLLSLECSNLTNHYFEPVYSAIPAPGRRFSFTLTYQPKE